MIAKGQCYTTGPPPFSFCITEFTLRDTIAGTAKYSIHVGREGGLLNSILLVVILVGDKMVGICCKTSFFGERP